MQRDCELLKAGRLKKSTIREKNVKLWLKISLTLLCVQALKKCLITIDGYPPLMTQVHFKVVLLASN